MLGRPRMPRCSPRSVQSLSPPCRAASEAPGPVVDVIVVESAIGGGQRADDTQASSSARCRAGSAGSPPRTLGTADRRVAARPSLLAPCTAASSAWPSADAPAASDNRSTRSGAQSVGRSSSPISSHTHTPVQPMPVGLGLTAAAIAIRRADDVWTPTATPRSRSGVVLAGGRGGRWWVMSRRRYGRW